MPYAILRFQKAKQGGVAGRDRHNERKKEEYKSNPDIEKQRSSENYHLIQPTGTYKEEYEKRIKEAGCRVRSNSVVMVETLITASPEFMAKLNPDQQRQFFQRAADFVYSRVGKQNVASAVVHMDEKTPHMHLLFVPITPDGHLSAKTILGNRADLSKWQDAFHDHMSKFYPELQRGIPKAITGRKHIPAYLFKQAAELSKSYEIIEKLEGTNIFNVKSVSKEVMRDMSHLIKICTSLAAKTTETDDYIKSLEKEIERQKRYIAAQDKTIEQRDEKNEELCNELILAERDIRNLQSQQRMAQKILDRIPPEVRTEIERHVKREARGYER